MKPCSILISSYRPREAIELCIESILERTEYPEFEIIVYDSSGDTDTTRKYLEQQEKSGTIKLITVPDWAEHGEAINSLISHCKTPLACILDSDVEIKTSDWLTSLTSMMIGIGVSKYLEAGFRFGTTLYTPIYWPPCMLLDMDLYRQLGVVDWKIKWIPINEYPHMELFKKRDVERNKKDYVVGDTGWEFAEKILFDNPIGTQMATLSWDWWKTKIEHYGGISSNWWRPDHPRVANSWGTIRKRLRKIRNTIK